jgi:hypothetical protein
MLRLRAVRELLVEEVAGLRLVRPEGEEDAAAAAREEGALRRVRLRAAWVVALDALALALLLALREGDRFLHLGRRPETIFTLGVLVVAVHLGFRLGQYLTYRNVARVHEELRERETP